MRTKPVGFGALPGVTVNQRKQPGTSEAGFEKVLKEACSGLRKEGSLPSGEGLNLLSAPAVSMGSFNPSPTDPSWLKSQGVKKAEAALNLLEQYQQALIDPDISLRKLDPLIQSLSRQVEGLRELAQKLAPSDPLQKLMTEVGVLSAVEIEKFKHGKCV